MLSNPEALVYLHRVTGFYYDSNLIFKLVLMSPEKIPNLCCESWKLLGDPKQCCPSAAPGSLFIGNLFLEDQKGKYYVNL